MSEAALALVPDAPPEESVLLALPVHRYDGPPVNFAVGREHREPSRLVAETATRIGGLNPLGEPKFRVIWSDSRVETQGGEWFDEDEHGNFVRRVIGYRTWFRYHFRERWVLELWHPAEHYGSPDTWRRANATVIDGISLEPLGDYPSRGDYEHLFTFEHPKDNSYIEPTEAMVEHWIRGAFRGQALSRREIERRILARKAKEEEAEQEETRLLIRRILDPRIDQHARVFVTSAGREVPRL